MHQSLRQRLDQEHTLAAHLRRLRQDHHRRPPVVPRTVAPRATLIATAHHRTRAECSSLSAKVAVVDLRNASLATAPKRLATSSHRDRRVTGEAPAWAAVAVDRLRHIGTLHRMRIFRVVPDVVVEAPFENATPVMRAPSRST